MKKRIIILTAIVAVIAIACFVVPRAIAETSDPSTTIDGHNLSLEDRINIVYYVTSQDVPSNAEEGVLIWIDEPEIYAYGTEDYKITSFQKSGQYKLFYFNGLAAKQINDEVKAMSYVKVGDDIYCSDIDTYSIATYCFKKMDSTTLGADGVTTLGTVVKDILKYGTVSQKYFGYNTENLAYDVEDHTIDSCFIDSDGHLIINYSTGESVDVGNVRGDPGQSAYELARDMAGFTGTQEEWLQSLKGSDGVGIEDISVNSDGELVFTMSDGSTKSVVLPGTSSADTNSFIFHLLEDGTYGVKAGTAKFYQEVVIPSTYKGLPVTMILDNAFSNSTDIESITIPDSVTSIGDSAFNGCRALTSIEIPASVTSIGNRAFYECRSLTSIEVPNSVTSLGDGVFNECTSLTSISIPDSVTSISNEVFFNCSSLTSIEIPDSVTSIGDWAFYGCTGLANIEIPDSVASIGDWAFSGCTSLTSIEIPDSVTSIGDWVFCNCTSLANIEIPDSVASISDRAFSGCTSLANIEIPDSVASIGNYAFYSCTSLTNIEIPDSVTSIGDGAFYICSNLTNVTIGNGVTNIGVNMFYYCTNLESIEIPASVTNIGGQAFCNCTSLVSIEIPDSVTSIGDGAFSRCTSLANIEIPDSVTSIGQHAFRECTSLESITIHNSIEVIGSFAFANCDNLTDIYFYGTPVQWNNIEIIEDNGPLSNATIHFIYSEGLEYSPNGDGTCSIAGIGTCTDISILIPPEIEGMPVTSIWASAFYDCKNIVSITIPDSVTFIDAYAFEGCSNMKRIDLPNNITSIAYATFYSCSSLSSIQLPASITSIGERAFAGCSGLTSINLHNNVTSISKNAFIGCQNLTDVYYNGTQSQWNNISIDSTGNSYLLNANIHCQDPYNLLYENNFDGTCTITGISDCVDASIVNIPSSIDGLTVTAIGYEAFAGCTSLTSIEIPGSVTSIEDHAFAGCTSLTSIEIPDSVTFIGSQVFHNCANLTSLTIPYVGNSNNATGRSALFGELFGYYYDETETGIVGITQYYFTQYGSDIASFSAPYYLPATLRTVIITSAEAIPECAFWGCHMLTNIIINNGVTSIGNNAFCNCSSLSGIEIPDSVMIIGDAAFSGCTSLASIVIPDSVMTISRSAFSGCTSLSSIEIPDSVTNIGDYAFSSCTSLSSIEIPDSVTNIGEYAFSSCTSLASIVIPDSVTNIGRFAFENCTSLSRIDIPLSISFNMNSVFDCCNNLTDVFYEGTINQWYANFAYYDDRYDFTVHCSDGIVTDSEILMGCRDEITLNGQNMANYGNSIYTEVSLPSSSIGSDLRIWGWVSTLSEIQSFGYSIDGGALITGDYSVEDEVVASMGEYASRYEILVPIEPGKHIISVFVLTENATCRVWTISVTA